MNEDRNGANRPKGHGAGKGQRVTSDLVVNWTCSIIKGQLNSNG